MGEPGMPNRLKMLEGRGSIMLADLVTVGARAHPAPALDPSTLVTT